MTKASPSLNTRFANIELDQENRPRPLDPSKSTRKPPPDLKCPELPHTNTTPSRAPHLSTAARANSRNKSPVCQPLLKRNLQASHTPRTPTHGKQTRIQDLPYMRGTSSLMNKQSSVPVYDRTFPQTRSSSHTDLYFRRTNQPPVARKRQLAKPLRHAGPETRPVQQQAKQQAPQVPFADTPTLFSSYSPPRQAPPAERLPLKQSVHDRLYQSSTLSRLAKHHALSTLAKAPQLPQAPPRPRSANLRLTPPNLASVLAVPLSKSTSHLAVKKPATVYDMCSGLYRVDRLFFEPTNSWAFNREPRPCMSSSSFLDSTQASALSVYERGELMRCSQLYYIPLLPKKTMPNGLEVLPPELEPRINISSFKDNFGFDDRDGNYHVRVHDHIGYRYEIKRVLGTGSFGNVVLCTDHKYSGEHGTRQVAVKIIKNELDWSLQAVSEIKLLKHLRASLRNEPNPHVMNYFDHFHFRGHMCIVSEVLDINLFTFLELQNFKGVSLSLLAKFAKKVLQGLNYIHNLKIIHCDIKPENIMMKLPSGFNPHNDSAKSSLALDFDVKLIDFGLSCFVSETSFSYIQSRYYRAPEVILGARYNHKIDIWSFGCVMAELFMGAPLLPGKSELEQIALVLETFGPPPSSFILSERTTLERAVKSAQHRQLKNPELATKPHLPADEKHLKKTLLYQLFNAEGKTNLQFLNMHLQHLQAQDPTRAPSPLKKAVKLSSRSMEVVMRLHGSGEPKLQQSEFSRFMGSIFQWNTRERPNAAELLQSSFFRVVSQPSDSSLAAA